MKISKILIKLITKKKNQSSFKMVPGKRRTDIKEYRKNVCLYIIIY